MKRCIAPYIALGLATLHVNGLAGEPIVVHLARGKNNTISVNGMKKDLLEITAWFRELRRQFGKNESIDVQCEEDVTLLDAVQFLKAINAASWSNLTVRSVPKNPANWRLWTAVPGKNQKVPLIMEPSPE